MRPLADLFERRGASDGTKVASSVVHVTNRHLVLAGTFVLLLPNLLFALQLRPIPGVVMLAGATVLIAVLIRGAPASADGVLTRRVDVLRLSICSALGIGLLVLGGEGHLMFANWDWLWRDAVLADLVKAPFPPSYQVGEQTFFLRAPLGMYMVPAFIAKATSLGIGHAALLVQNAILLALVLYMVAALAGRHAILIVGVFIAFSGLDAFGHLLGWLKHGGSLSSFVLPSHIESWTAFQYSSVLTQLFWVPNHALPSYWMVVLILLCAKREVGVVDLSLALAACVFWSPFAFIGAAPFVLYLFMRNARSTMADARLWLAACALLCFAPVALYMQSDAAAVPHAFILFYPSVASIIALFLIVEIPHVLVCRHVWGDYDKGFRPLLLLAIAVLVVLPTMRLGLNNDLVMRASIPALMILAVAFGEALNVAWTEGHWRLLACGALIALVAAITPLQEVRRSFAFSRYAISDCNLPTVWKTLAPQLPSLDNYLARSSTEVGWLLPARGATPSRANTDRACWPDYPFDPHVQITQLSNAMIEEAHRSARP